MGCCGCCADQKKAKKGKQPVRRKKVLLVFNILLLIGGLVCFVTRCDI